MIKTTYNPAFARIMDAIFAHCTSEPMVKLAYRAAAARIHPDVSSDPNAAEMFIALQAAKEIAIARVNTKARTEWHSAQSERERQHREERERNARSTGKARTSGTNRKPRTNKSKLSAAERILNDVCARTGWVWTRVFIDRDGDTCAEFEDGTYRTFKRGQWTVCEPTF